MRTRYINKIQIDQKNIPYKWMENLVSNGKIGGVLLVYVEGFTQTEIDTKTKAIKEFCKTLKEVSENMGPADKPDTFRKDYTPLDEEQKEKMTAIKDKAQELLDLFDSTVTREERSDRSRCMAVARTNLETTIMWAIKGVTSAKVNTTG